MDTRNRLPNTILPKFFYLSAVYEYTVYIYLFCSIKIHSFEQFILNYTFISNLPEPLIIADIIFTPLSADFRYLPQ